MKAQQSPKCVKCRSGRLELVNWNERFQYFCKDCSCLQEAKTARATRAAWWWHEPVSRCEERKRVGTDNGRTKTQ